MEGLRICRTGAYYHITNLCQAKSARIPDGDEAVGRGGADRVERCKGFTRNWEVPVSRSRSRSHRGEVAGFDPVRASVRASVIDCDPETHLSHRPSIDQPWPPSILKTTPERRRGEENLCDHRRQRSCPGAGRSRRVNSVDRNRSRQRRSFQTSDPTLRNRISPPSLRLRTHPAIEHRAAPRQESRHKGISAQLPASGHRSSSSLPNPLSHSADRRGRMRRFLRG